MITVNYDARALKPSTRHWGPGVVVTKLLEELNPHFNMQGVSHSTEDSREMGLQTWPSLGKLDKLVFEISPWLSQKCDLYWGTNLFIPRVLQAPSVITVHDLLLFDFPNDQPGARYFQDRFASSVKRASAIITDSKTSADKLIQRFPHVASKTEVGLLGYEPAVPEIDAVGQMKEKFPGDFVVVLGAHRPRKRLDVAIQAVSNLRETGRDLKLLVTGDIHSSFADLVQKHGDFVISTGVLLKIEVLALIKNALAVLFPTTYEGFGFPVLEAMAMDTPVMASDIDILREISGEKAVHVPLEASAWSPALEQIVNDSSFRENLVVDGRENLKRFSWQKTGELYRDVFNRVLGV